MLTWQEHRRDAADTIAKILGDSYYLLNHEPAGLTEAVLGPHLPGRVSLDLYFPHTKPPVAVVFQPINEAGACRLEARKWCHDHGILWVPVFAHERLTNARFADRLRHDWLVMALAHGISGDQTLPGLVVPSALDAIEMDREALRLLAAEVKRNGNLRGATRSRRLKTIRRNVEVEWARRKRRGAHPLEPSPRS